MSWDQAPIYVEAHDLSRWVVERVQAWPRERDRHLGRPVLAAACELLSSVSLALTFPETRIAHLRQADESVVRLRVLLRLARDTCLISPGGLRHAQGRLRAIGRMIGGWRRRVRTRASSSSEHDSGDGLPASTA